MCVRGSRTPLRVSCEVEKLYERFKVWIADTNCRLQNLRVGTALSYDRRWPLELAKNPSESRCQRDKPGDTSGSVWEWYSTASCTHARIAC
jgi:hypothetical protein